MMMKILTTILTLSLAINAHAAPIMNVFELGVKNTAQYDQIAQYNIQTSIDHEKGTLAMYSVKSQDTPNLAYMVEMYADDVAYQIHSKSPQYQTFIKNSPDILTDHKQRIALTPQFLGDKKVAQTPNTRTNWVMVEVKPQDNESFKNIVLEEMAQSLNVENGVLAMYAATYQDNPNKWLFFEIYADDAAYQAHRETRHFQNYLSQTADMVVRKEYKMIAPQYLGNQGGLWFGRE